MKTCGLTPRSVLTGLAARLCVRAVPAHSARMSSMTRFIEVSHVIEPGMVTYPGLPVPQAEVIIDHDSSRAAA